MRSCVAARSHSLAKLRPKRGFRRSPYLIEYDVHGRGWEERGAGWHGVVQAAVEVVGYRVVEPCGTESDGRV